MNYLQLSERLCDECSVPRSGLTTTVGQAGELLRMVNWINAAWLDIQNEHSDWEWLRASASCATVNAQATYTPSGDFGLTDFGTWAKDTFRLYTTADGYSSEVYLPHIDYERWRDLYQFGSNRTSYSKPTSFTVTPSTAIGLGPVPTGGYTILGDYYKAASELSGDSDTPELPTHYQLAIVYRAMMYYGTFYAAAEIYSAGEREYRKVLRRMTIDRIPSMSFGCPLA